MRHPLLQALLIMPLVAAATAAQTTSAELAAGDRAYAALDAVAAFAHYQRAAALDTTSFEAAWKASRSAADLEATARGDRRGQAALLQEAEAYARRAVSLRPDDAEGHFSVARALGLAARSVGIRERVRYAEEVRDRALRCLRYAPRHPGCLHILGAWNAEVMRLSGVERFIARRVLGGRTFAAASWAEAIAHLEAAVAAEPRRMIHRVELGNVYRDAGRIEDARREYEEALRLPASDYGDSLTREQAQGALRQLR